MWDGYYMEIKVRGGMGFGLNITQKIPNITIGYTNNILIYKSWKC